MIAYILIEKGIILAADIDKKTIEKMIDKKTQRIAEVEVTNKRLSLISEDIKY